MQTEGALHYFWKLLSACLTAQRYGANLHKEALSVQRTARAVMKIQIMAISMPHDTNGMYIK